MIKCCAFEDKKSTIAVEKSPSMLPRIKNIGMKYHYFRSYVNSEKISISYVPTEDQLTDMMIKPLLAAQFQYL